MIKYYYSCVNIKINEHQLLIQLITQNEIVSATRKIGIRYNYCNKLIWHPTKVWFRNKLLHRDNGPAYIIQHFTNGHFLKYENKKLL